jgi:hypothetical protein
VVVYDWEQYYSSYYRICWSNIFDGIPRFFQDIKTVLVSYKTVIRRIQVPSYTRRTGRYTLLLYKTERNLYRDFSIMFLRL